MIDSRNKVDVVTVDSDLAVDIQYAIENANLDTSDEAGDSEEPPNPELLTKWAQAAYAAVASDHKHAPEVTIRIVGNTEMRDLNYQYRAKDKTTNVLSFPFENEFSSVTEIATGLLGDVVVCHPVVVTEAKLQLKSLQDHYAHMVAHGILHLCGLDHQNDQEAEQMEAIEAKILSQLNISNPYAVS